MERHLFAKIFNQKNADVKNAALIFCSWAVWDYCMNNDMLPSGNKNDIANNYIATVCAYVGNTHEMDALDFHDEQLRYVYSLIAKEFAADEIKTLALLSSSSV